MSLLLLLNQIEQFPLTYGQVYHWIACLQDEGIKISKQSLIKHMSAWCHCPETGRCFLRVSKQHVSGLCFLQYDIHITGYLVPDVLKEGSVIKWLHRLCV